MNSGITAERVYTALKRRLLDGEFKPGERLDPALLSETLSSSVTPVRDVLNILRGERLVETRTGEGFFRPHLTAPDLEDLYGWAEQILHLAIRQWDAPATILTTSAQGTVPDRIATLFQAVGDRSPNAEHGKAVTGTNDRLHSVRDIEAQILGDGTEELTELVRATDDARSLTRLLSNYHRRRQRVASELVRAVYRNS